MISLKTNNARKTIVVANSPQRPVLATEDKVAHPHVSPDRCLFARIQIEDVETTHAARVIGRKEKPAAVGIEGQRCDIVNRTAANIGKMFYPSRSRWIAAR